MPESTLAAWAIHADDPIRREQWVRQAREEPSRPLLILHTCQRLECFGRPDALPAHPFRVVCSAGHRQAFERLARIAAGLESRVLGELEVLGQVREAYRQFNQQGGTRDAALDRIFQDALSLARKARRESGMDRAGTSIASLAAHALLEELEPGRPVAVVGSGVLAGSVVRVLARRGKSPVRIAGRCPAHALRLAQEVGGFSGGLDQLESLFEGIAGLITATAAPHPVVFARHLEQAARPLHIIDLGVPPDCADDVRALDHVRMRTLAHIEDRANRNWDERRRRAEHAARIIAEGADAWAAGR